MLHSMGVGFASRLKQNGDDVEGWLRLVRGYMVKGERDKAKSALTDTRQAGANDAERLRQLNDGLKNLGLDGWACCATTEPTHDAPAAALDHAPRAAPG